MGIVGPGVWSGCVRLMLRWVLARAAAGRYLMSGMLRGGDCICRRMMMGRDGWLADSNGAGVARLLLERELALRWRSGVMVPGFDR